MNTRKNPIDLSAYYATNKPLMRDVDTSNVVSWNSAATRNLYTLIPSDDATNTANEITNRFFVALNYDFNLLTRQSATATVSIANKKDKTFYKRDQDNINFSASVTSFYEIPLQTTVAFIVSHNASYAALQDSIDGYLATTQKQSFNYQTISFNARYRMMDDRLNLLATLTPSFGDFKRFLIQAGADYQILENHYIVGQIDFIQNPGKASDVIFSIIYRFMF